MRNYSGESFQRKDINLHANQLVKVKGEIVTNE